MSHEPTLQPFHAIDLDDFIGQRLINFSLGNWASVHPCLYAIVPAEADAQEIAATLTRELQQALLALGHVAGPTMHDPVCVEAKTSKIIQDKPGREAEWKQSFDRLSEMYSKAAERRKKEIAANPNLDDGKRGFWAVEGIRHSCLVSNVSSAQEAIDKAKDAVGSWEMAEATYIGAELPEVFSL